MQLTDDEIRSILAEEKKKKRRKQRMRRRIAALVLLIVLVAIIAALGSRVNRKPAVEPRGVIFIDASHGGKDNGSSDGKRYEKDDALTLAKALKTRLEAANFTVVMSREDDIDIDRAERCRMANESGAKLMVSIHRNQLSSGKGRGVEAYIPKRDDAGSRLLAENLVNALAAQGFKERKVSPGTLVDPDADYEEIGHAEMPACLIEVGFITNNNDNELFDNNLEKNAQAMSDAISDTFKMLFESDSSEEQAE